MADEFPKTKINSIKRIPERGHYDHKTVFDILDDAQIAHVSVVTMDKGQPTPVTIPMLYGREEQTIYLHGHSSMGLKKLFADSPAVCISVSLIDALVLAKSLFHHSVNYRSVVIHGIGSIVESEEERLKGMTLVTEHILKGRWEEARLPNDAELKSTAVLRVDIDVASAKVRTGESKDDKEDEELPYWAGLVPLRVVAGSPIPHSSSNVDIPYSVKSFLQKRS